MFLTTYLGVPVGCSQLYHRLCRRMCEAGVHDPPEESLLVLTTVLGGWLMVTYAALFDVWVGFIYLVLLYLLVVAPLLMLPLVIHLIPRRQFSAYHSGALKAGAAYVCAAGVLLAGLLCLTAAGAW